MSQRFRFTCQPNRGLSITARSCVRFPACTVTAAHSGAWLEDVLWGGHVDVHSIRFCQGRASNEGPPLDCRHVVLIAVC